MVDILSLCVHFIFLKFCELSVQSCNFYNLSPANISLHYNKNKKNLKLVFKNGYFSASNRISLICLIIQSAHITLVPVTFRVSRFYYFIFGKAVLTERQQERCSRHCFTSLFAHFFQLHTPQKQCPTSV